MLYTPDTFRITLYTPEPLPTPPTILPTPIRGLEIGFRRPCGADSAKIPVFWRSCGALQLLTHEKMFYLLYLEIACMYRPFVLFRSNSCVPIRTPRVQNRCSKIARNICALGTSQNFFLSVIRELRGSVKGIILSFVYFVNRETSTRHGLQNYEGIGARFVKGKFQKWSDATVK